jgi:pimeloyl-ACP methyl ester carboxylesterase
VYEDRDAASGRQIELRVVVYPALGRDRQPDPLFVLAGGPGQGAAQVSSAVVGLFRDVRKERDIVFVDQRGTGQSNGLPCD